MKRIVLERHPSQLEHTEGFMLFDKEILATIEQEWRPHSDGDPGGESNNSCVPAGKYHLIPHTRPDGKKVVALVNEDLGVYYLAEHRPHGKGRFLILIHIGNWVKDIVGCIAPGLSKGNSDQGRMVQSSTAAMSRLTGELLATPLLAKEQRLIIWFILLIM